MDMSCIATPAVLSTWKDASTKRNSLATQKVIFFIAPEFLDAVGRDAHPTKKEALITKKRDLV